MFETEIHLFRYSLFRVLQAPDTCVAFVFDRVSVIPEALNPLVIIGLLLFIWLHAFISH